MQKHKSSYATSLDPCTQLVAETGGCLSQNEPTSGNHTTMVRRCSQRTKPPLGCSISQAAMVDDNGDKFMYTYTLWQTNITMENHHVQWVNPL